MRISCIVVVVSVVVVVGGMGGYGCHGAPGAPSDDSTAKSTERSSSPSEPDQPAAAPGGPDRADRVYEEGDWKLEITYVNKGTRSEGIHGVLLHRGKVVIAAKRGEVLDTDLGRMEYLGKRGEQARPWDPTGWLFADREKRPGPSWRK